jgi:hypothetical protein
LSHVVVAAVTHVTRGDELCHATKTVRQKLSANGEHTFVDVFEKQPREIADAASRRPRRSFPGV